MEAIYAIIPQLGKAGNVAALFGGTFGLFAFLEQLSSKTARADRSKYLTSASVVLSSIQLHDGPLLLFDRVFGPRHFSLRCLVRSMMVSLPPSPATESCGAMKRGGGSRPLGILLPHSLPRDRLPRVENRDSHLFSMVPTRGFEPRTY